MTTAICRLYEENDNVISNYSLQLLLLFAVLMLFRVIKWHQISKDGAWNEQEVQFS